MKLSRPRIALYSPGMVGLGHMRRNLLIAQMLARSRLHPVILMIAEAQEAAAFRMPPGVDCVTLPSLAKDWAGRILPRRLALDVQYVVDLRSRVIRSALNAFRPDVLIVDHLPRGAVHELDRTLEDLRRNGTRCVLGLRDILESPDTTRHEWTVAGSSAAIHRYYDAIWVYGDQAIYDLAAECQFPPDVTKKLKYSGYLDQRERIALGPRNGPAATGDADHKRLILCTLGGGQDGGHLAQTFADTEFPADADGVILTGPFMPSNVRRRLHRMSVERPQLHVLGFIPEPTRLVAQAERIIGMAGYNTVCEVLSFGKRALIVPRAGPRQEQSIRAERLQALGLIDVVPRQRLSPRVLANWLHQELPSVPPATGRVDMKGLCRIVRWTEDLLTSAHGSIPQLPTGRREAPLS